jgi:hypothetical protein
MKKKQNQGNSSNPKLVLNKMAVAKLNVLKQKALHGGDDVATAGPNCQTNTGENCDAKKCILGSKVKI